MAQEMLKQKKMKKMKKKKKKEMALAVAPKVQGAAHVPTGAAVVPPGVPVPAVATARVGRARARTKCHWGHWVQGVVLGRDWLVGVWAWA